MVCRAERVVALQVGCDLLPVAFERRGRRLPAEVAQDGLAEAHVRPASGRFSLTAVRMRARARSALAAFCRRRARYSASETISADPRLRGSTPNATRWQASR